MSWATMTDYKSLLTGWLAGPCAVLLCFILGFIAWKIWLFLAKKREAVILKRPAQINLNEQQKLLGDEEKGLKQSRSSIFSTPKSPQINIQFKNLGLHLRTNGSKVLDGVTGEITAGRMTAVMGPSGSGKTTFMTTIAGKATYGKMSGTVLINERSDLPIRTFKNMTGFVPQEDIMLREMTVEETLKFAALTRLPRDMAYKEKMNIVEDVLELLDLKAIRFSQIGDENVRGISGGQRKRVNIGMELVSDPTLLFLDEPTSGLDSTTSMSICGALRQIASLGLTIVAVIHQPRYEIFTMFHDVLLLAKGGRTVYHGPTEDAIGYFESLGYQCPNHVNPSDFFIDIVSGLQVKTDGTVLSSAQLLAEWEKHHKSKIAERAVDEDGDAYDTGVNPLELRDFWKFIKQAFEYGKKSLKVPALSSNELFSVNQERPYGFAPDEISLGKRSTGVFCFLFSLLMFISTPFAVFNVWGNTPPSIYRQYGGIFGFFGGILALLSYYLIRFLSLLGHKIEGVGYFGFIVFCIIPWCLVVPTILLLVKRFKERKPIPYIRQIMGAFFGSFVYLYMTWNKPDTTIPKRMATLLGLVLEGYGICILVSAILLRPLPSSLPYHFLPFSPEAASILTVYILVAFLLARRMHILPINNRPNPSVKKQFLYCTARAFVQISRRWLIFSFDLFLVISAGVFIGIIYYQQYYEPPIIDELPNGQCPESLPDKACTILSIPQKDPFASQASVTCLAIALAAVASTMRVFGDETVAFRRESGAGLRTEAYYFAKTLAHLPTEILAPLMFSLCYYAVVLPISPFYQYFFLYFLIYFCFAGLAFFISLITPPSLSQLAGVLSVLSFMMFSGAAPTLQQLKYNELLPFCLWAFSWVSPFRYTQELYYLIGILPYDPSPDTATLLHYGYNLTDSILCWMMILAIGILFRTFAYFALVWRERRS